MRKGLVFFLPLLSCALAFGQLDSNSITVTASNNASLQPDEALFSVSVTSSQTTGLDDVLAALQPVGVTVGNFSGVSTQPSATLIVGGLSTTSAPTLIWSFTLPAPLANTKATVATLTSLQQNIAKANSGLTMAFSIAGTQVSQQLSQSQTCSLPALITAATTQAQTLAAAGSLTLGSILAMSSSTSNAVYTPTNVIAGPGYVSSSGGTSVPPPCAVTVKFNATRH